MNLESRLAAVEADLAALKRHLNLAALPPPFVPESLPLRSRPPRSPAAKPPASLLPSAAPRSPSKEVAFGAYWMTRIGAILVLLAAIFLAAYASIFSSPGIRVSELLLGASTALGIAYWQQGKGHRGFAVALHSLADALFFFTAFAAYAFSPTRVIVHLGAAIAAQAIAAAFVCGHALQRRSEASATFALVLLAWAASFSLWYEQSAATLAFVALIASAAAILRHRHEWRWPLLYAAIAGPALVVWLDFAAPGNPLAIQISLGALPLLTAIPLVRRRGRLAPMDAGALFASLGAGVGAALAVRYSAGGEAFQSQLLIDAVVFLAIAAALGRKADLAPADATLGARIGFGSAATAALYLHMWRPDANAISLGILGLGILTALWGRRGRPAVPGWLYFIFWGIALIHRWPGAAFPYGAPPYSLALAEVAGSAALLLIALERELLPPVLALMGVAAMSNFFRFDAALHPDSAALLSFLGLAVAAAAVSSRFKRLAPWSIAALAFAHFRVLGDSSFRPPHWPAILAILAVADAAALYGLTWIGPRVPRVVQLLAPLAMLGTLFYGFAASGTSREVTFIWVSLAGGTFLLGYGRANQNFRVAALAAFGACVIRLFAIDLSTTFTRIVAFFTLGVILIGVGYLYSRLHRSADRSAPQT